MQIHEYIKNIVNESVDEVRKAQLFEAIRPIIAESMAEAAKEKGGKKGKIKVDDLVDKLMKNDDFKNKALKYLTDHDAMQSLSNNLDGETYDEMDNMSKAALRRDVTQRLKDRKINAAPMAEELWPSMTPDAARSWFSKKANGKDGESFSDEEIAKIYHWLNNKMS